MAGRQPVQLGPSVASSTVAHTAGNRPDAVELVRRAQDRNAWWPFYAADAARPDCPNCGDQMVPDMETSLGTGTQSPRPGRTFWRCPACWTRSTTSSLAARGDGGSHGASDAALDGAGRYFLRRLAPPPTKRKRHLDQAAGSLVLRSRRPFAASATPRQPTHR